MELKSGWTGGLARAAAQRPWRFLGVWVLLLVGAFFLAGSLNTTDGGGVEDTEARRAIAFIEQLRGDQELTEEEFIVVEADASVDDATFAALVASIVDGVREVEVVSSAVSYLDGVEDLRTADGRVAMIPITTTLTASDDIDLGLPILDVVEEANETSGFRVTSIGSFSFAATFEELAEETFAKGELIGLAVAVVILLLVFGAAVAALLPILLALGAVFTAGGVVAAISQVYEVNTFTIIVLTMVGLAVGIDYSLFIVQRFREERDRGFNKLDAIEIAGSTASRTVLFSGITVAIALARHADHAGPPVQELRHRHHRRRHHRRHRRAHAAAGPPRAARRSRQLAHPAHRRPAWLAGQHRRLLGGDHPGRHRAPGGQRRGHLGIAAGRHRPLAQH